MSNLSVIDLGWIYKYVTFSLPYSLRVPITYLAAILRFFKPIL